LCKFYEAAGPADACFRSTVRISPAMKSSLSENFRSSATETLAETVPAQIFNVLLKLSLVTRWTFKYNFTWILWRIGLK
jgi:hypothetical protein